MIFAPDIIPVEPDNGAVVGMGGVFSHISIGLIQIAERDRQYF